MRDPEEVREEKLEGRDIRLGGAMGKERPHGKVYRWLDNFWYHHKWKTIFITFFAIVLLICTLQMCNREEEGDMSVLLIGPTSFMDENAGLADLQKLLALELPEDYDGNGEKKVDTVYYTVYNETHIKAFAEQGVSINTAANSSTYQQAISFMQTGECSVLFLDPWVAAQVKNALVDVEGLLGYRPEGAVTADREGKELVIGVRLGDTALYRENTAMQALPEDTVICLAAPIMGGKSDNEVDFDRAKDYYKALIGAN